MGIDVKILNKFQPAKSKTYIKRSYTTTKWNCTQLLLCSVSVSFIFIFYFLAALWHMEFPGQGSDLNHSCDTGSFLLSFQDHTRGIWQVPRLEVKSELQLPAYTIAIAMPNPSHICDLCHSSQQHQILNPVGEARESNPHPHGYQLCLLTAELQGELQHWIL